jgi:phosphoribosyl 1,2-cyclic phosphodiesterase
VRFCCLGSGSEGNSLVVETEFGKKTRILVDCGLKFDVLEQRLLTQGVLASEIDGIFITHEHGDHIRSAAKFARIFDIPLFMTHGSFYACRGNFGKIKSLSFLRSDKVTILNGFNVLPFSIPHDAREPVALVFEDPKHRLGVLTDAGSITPHIIKSLSKLDGLVLEFNYDPSMLKKSKYPDSLKKRISSPFGHLSNDAARKLLKNIFHDKLQVIVAAHLSQKNNTPELVNCALDSFINDFLRTIIADQREPTGWISLN